MIDEQAVWITGVGAISPLGGDFAEISASLLAGKSAIRPVTGFDASEHPCQIAGQVSLPECPPDIDHQIYESGFPLDRCTILCCLRSLKDARLWGERSNLRIGLVLGVAAEAMSHWDTDVRRGGSLIYDDAATRPSSAAFASRALELSGPTVSVAAA